MINKIIFKEDITKKPEYKIQKISKIILTKRKNKGIIKYKQKGVINIYI